MTKKKKPYSRIRKLGFLDLQLIYFLITTLRCYLRLG